MGFQAGTPDFSGKLAKPVLVRVVAKQLFYGTGTPLAEIPGLHSQNMRDKPCRIVSAAGNFACDLFRQNFRGFRLTTPLFASHTRSSTSMRSWRGWNWGDGNFGGSGLQPRYGPEKADDVRPWLFRQFLLSTIPGTHEFHRVGCAAG